MTLFIKKIIQEILYFLTLFFFLYFIFLSFTLNYHSVEPGGCITGSRSGSPMLERLAVQIPFKSL